MSSRKTQIINSALDISEMSNYPQKVTGLPMLIWISTKNTVHGRHGPRIKIQDGRSNRASDKWRSITIEDSPKLVEKTPFETLKDREIQEAIDWVKEFKQPLLDYWEGNISKGKLESIISQDL